jgi:Secretion system C-terminal sorting domain
MKQLLLIFLILLIASATTSAMDSAVAAGKGPLRSLESWVDWDNRVLNAGAFLMNISNHGYIGNDGANRAGAFNDPCTGEWAPQGEYPAELETQYMYRGGVWIGAMIDTGEYFYPRVSVASEGWQGDEEYVPLELIGEESCIDGYPSCIGETQFNQDGWAPQELISTYSDTVLILPGGSVIDHPFDGPHVPLGLKVTQTSRAFSSVDYDKIAHFEYEIENVGDNRLMNVYFGLFVDADIGSYAAPGNHYEDDITGYRSESGVAYMMDNDGRPESVPAGNDFSCPHVVGVLPLTTPDQTGVDFSYNWWISNADTQIDFGPAWANDHSPGNWTGQLGTPVTDADKYFLLSNGEIDYPTYEIDDQDWIENHPQLYVDPVSGEETSQAWREVNAADPTDLANGYDIRCLMSFGPFGIEEGNARYLEPGETLAISFAIVFADDVHDANNPQVSNTILDPAKYDFSDLDAMANLARELHNLADSTPPPPAPILAASFGLSGTVITWYPSPVYLGTDFTLERRMQNAVEWEAGPVQFSDEDFVHVDRTARVGDVYEYRARSTRAEPDQSSNWGPTSVVSIGAQAPVKNILATSADSQVSLSWDAPPAALVDEYIIWRAWQDTLDGDYQDAELVGRTTEPEFTDTSVLNGYYYSYQVQTSNNGILGLPSEGVEVLPAGLREKMLLLLNSYGTAFSPLWRPDSLKSHFDNLDWADKTVDVMLVDFDADTLTLPDITDYDVLWFELNGLADPFPRGSFFYFDLLPLYIETGGHVAVSGLNSINKLFFADSAPLGHTEWLETVESMDHPMTVYMPFNSVFVTTFASLWPQEMFPEWLLHSVPAVADGFQTMTVDVDRHYFPANAIPDYYGTGWTTAMLPREGATVLYTLNFELPEIEINFAPGALIWHGESGSEDWGVACFGMPMFYLGPDDEVAATMLHVADELRNGSEIDAQSDSSPASSSDELTVMLHPNPANASTTVRFTLPESGDVRLRVYNVMGREVWQMQEVAYSAGIHSVTLDGNGLASGLYFVRVDMGAHSATAKLMIVK